MQKLTASLCLMLFSQFALSPAILAQSADHMDLSSTTRDMSASNSGTIRVGNTIRQININDALTAAESMALQQVLNGGNQSLVLGAAGNAVSGQFTMTGGTPGAMVVPNGVTGIQTGANLNVTGNFINNGNFYAVSTNAAVTTATINANNIINQQGAVLSTLLPAGGIGVPNAISNLNLSLNAINDIINHGTISSAGNLSMSAGGSITNTSVAGSQAVMQAANNMSMVSNYITNSGLMQSLGGNIDIASQVASSLIVNNICGRIEALNGQINVRDASVTEKIDTTIRGGDIVTNALNIFSGDGIIDVNVNDLQGTVNVNGGIAHVVARTGELELGSIHLTGDPTFYNLVGNIVLREDLIFPGQHLAIISGGSIISDGLRVISTASNNNGGSLTLIAGAVFETSGIDVVNQPPSPPDNSSIITVLGSSPVGGRIDFTTNPIAVISTTGGFNHGGDVTMVAYDGIVPMAGTISIPDITFQTGSSGTDLNGNVTLIAGAPGGTAIQVGSINTEGANNSTGSIYMLTAEASMTGCAQCIGKVNILDGKIISGAFNTDPDNLPSNGNASIVTGDLTSSGGAIQLIAAGNVTTGLVRTVGNGPDNYNGGIAMFGDNVTTGLVRSGGGAITLIAENQLVTGNISNLGQTTGGINGGIALVAGALNGQAITTGNLTTAGSFQASGDIVVITSAPTSPYCPSCPASNRQTDTLGFVQLGEVASMGAVDLRAGGELQVPSIISLGTARPEGGVVSILANQNNATTATFNVGGSGSNYVGSIVVHAGGGGAGSIGIASGGEGGITVVNRGALQLQAPAQGNGGAIGFSATNGNLSVDGDWNVDGTVNGNGGLLNFAGQTITFSSAVQMSANGAGEGNGGSITVTATNLNLPSTTAVLSANGSGSFGQGGLLTLSSTNQTTLGAGGVIMTANGSQQGFGGSVNFGSQGAVNFNSSTVELSATAEESFGGRVDVFAGTNLNVGTGSLSADASSLGDGGVANLRADTVNATTGTISMNASGESGAGGFVQLLATNINTGAGAMTVQANSHDSFGGTIDVLVNNIDAGTGGVTVEANGGVGGGFIVASINSTSGSGNVAMSANGTADTFAASGGAIFLSADSSSNLNLGSGGGQISLSATGSSADGSQANGGQLFANAGQNITVNGSGLNVSTAATDGDGGLISLSAGDSGAGTLQINGNISAEGRGTGNGGTILLQHQSSSAIVNSGTISVRALGAGNGGTITVSNPNSSSTTLALTNNGTMTATSASGTNGSIDVLSVAGDQDVAISGTGRFDGTLNSTGKSVNVQLTNTAPVTVGNVQSVAGNVTFRAPNIRLNNTNSVLASSGSMAVTSTSIVNEGSIESVGAMTVNNIANLTISGNGKMQGSSINLSSSLGGVNASQGEFVGTVSGTAVTNYSLTANTGELRMGNTGTVLGNITMVNNNGNMVIDDNAVITANFGNVTIRNNSASGTITLRPNASISTLTLNTLNNTGNIYIGRGAPPANPVNGVKPGTVQEIERSGGNVYYGAAGITAGCCGHVITADRRNVVFNGGGVILTSNNRITAQGRTLVQIVLAALQGAVGPILNPGGNVVNLPQVNPPAFGITTQNIIGLNSGLQSIASTILGFLSYQAEPTGIYGMPERETEIAGDKNKSSEFEPVAFVQGAAGLTGDKITAAFGTKTETAYIKHSASTRISNDAEKAVRLHAGEMVVSSDKDTVIKSGDCTIKVNANSIVHISSKDNTVKIHNLFDTGKHAVKVAIGSEHLSLSAGEEVVISSSSAHSAIAKDRVGRRLVRDHKFKTVPHSALTSEYSFTSLVNESPVLRQMLSQGAGDDKQIIDRMLKMAASLKTATQLHGAYSTDR